MSPASSPVTARSSDGSLSAVLTVAPGEVASGGVVSLDLSVTDSAATGPVGPMNLSYGDGQPVPETGAAASCHAGVAPTASSQSFQYSHTYSTPGSYTVSVTVSAPCSSETVVLEVPVTVVAP